MADLDLYIRQFTARRAQVLGYLRVLVRDAHMAEDLFQETALVVIKSIDRFDPNQDFDAWVRGIARNLVRNAMRKAGREHLMASNVLAERIDQAHANGSAHESDGLSEQLEQLKNCLDKIQGPNRELLDLRYDRKLSLKSIAQSLGRSAGAVQVALSRIRKLLAGCIQEQQNPESS